MALTEAGEALYRLAGKIFEIELLAEDCIRNFQDKNEQQIYIHASETFGAYYLPAFINRFNQCYPRVKISISIMLTDQVVENTLNVKNDIGFVSYPVLDVRLLIREVLEERFVLIVSPDHPLAQKRVIRPADLKNEVIVMHEKSSAVRKALLKFVDKEKIRISTSMEYSNNEAIKRAVELKAGVALISHMVAHKEIQRGELKAIPLSDAAIRRKFYLIRHKDRYISKSLENLLAGVETWARECQNLNT
jgi:DNA-binding transcriptional LysR family regulator